jgi:CDP-glycerol glycerophosphotransferase (TagB/SpsB family)
MHFKVNIEQMISKTSDYVAPFFDLAVAVIAWLFLAPLTLVIRRDPRLIVFFGRDGGKYIDNCKHLFATINNDKNDIRPVYLAKNKILRDKLRSLGGNSVVAGSYEAWRLWLTAGTIVVDNIDWPKGGRFPAARNARVVQLWHGIPLKHVQLTLFRSRLKRLPRPVAWGLRLQKLITGRFARSELFLSTSQYVTNHTFSSGFTYARASHAGYPRNDVLVRPGAPLAEFGVDPTALDRISEHRRVGGTTVGLYAPTFRRKLRDPFSPESTDLEKLSNVASELGILLLVKLHPWMHGRFTSRSLPSIHFVAPDSDGYPLMREVNFMITDYSSIFFDFLLLDRPILFFPYDLKSYLESDRPMYFDYNSMTPGPKVFDVSSLTIEIRNIRAGVDEWKECRKRVRKLVFQDIDGRAGERLMRELFPVFETVQVSSTPA